MSYDNWRVDGSPENSLIYRKQYSVHADISKCFPSVYTHSLAWALAGKNVAKANKNNRSLWYNQIDHLVQINKASYAIYFALKYKFNLVLTTEMLIGAEDCILLILGFLYFQREKNKVAVDTLKDYAKSLSMDDNDMERMWLFVYEALPQTALRDEWKTLKKAKVTFLKSI